MARDASKVVLAVIGVAVLGCLGTGLTVFGIGVFAASEFGGSTEWSEDAVPERELPRLFGVRLPVRPMLYRSRQQGFQDGFWEVVVQLPPGAAEAFLGLNKLERHTAGEALSPEVLELIRSLDPKIPALAVTASTTGTATAPDGGFPHLNRKVLLLEGPGAVWLYLEAFEG